MKGIVFASVRPNLGRTKIHVVEESLARYDPKDGKTKTFGMCEETGKNEFLIRVDPDQRDGLDRMDTIVHECFHVIFENVSGDEERAIERWSKLISKTLYRYGYRRVKE